MRIGFTPAARRDRRQAEAWYRRRSPSAAAHFGEEIEAALRYISEYPDGAPILHGRTRAKTVRGFPFAVLYIVLPDRLRVVAIADERRAPDFYSKRFE